MHVLRVDAGTCSAADLAPAVGWLAAGRILAFPTDTLYGLAVDPTSPEAVAAVFDVKRRAAGAALPLIAGSREQVDRRFGPLPPAAAALAARWWPGPLSLVLDAPADIAPGARAGGETVAVRVPDHRVARLIAETLGRPITATSANLSGEPPATSAAMLGAVADDDRVLVLDAGPAPGGAPSTIVDARGAVPVLVRDGAIAWSRVLESQSQ